MLYYITARPKLYTKLPEYKRYIICVCVCVCVCVLYLKHCNVTCLKIQAERKLDLQEDTNPRSSAHKNDPVTNTLHLVTYSSHLLYYQNIPDICSLLTMHTDAHKQTHTHLLSVSSIQALCKYIYIYIYKDLHVPQTAPTLGIYTAHPCSQLISIR